MKTPFVDNHGTFYVTVKRCGISPLLVHVCGLPLTGFKGDNNAYVKLDDLIAFYEKEIAMRPTSKIVRDNLQWFKRAAAELAADHDKTYAADYDAYLAKKQATTKSRSTKRGL